MSSAVFSLNHHATYACRHSGACCTAGWTIPVEPTRRLLLGASELPQPAGGACQFYDRGSRLCGVHRDHGEDAMPSACQHFPRRVLVDDRGTFVSLSHFCPTAASMLFESTEPLAIVTNPAAFPAGHDWDGLNARGQWPPLVNPGVLFDLDTYSAFEHFIVDTLARERAIDAALESIAGAVERLRQWNQRRGAFGVWADEAFEEARQRTARHNSELRMATSELMTRIPNPYFRIPNFSVYADVLRCVPPHHEPKALHENAGRAWRELASPVWSHFSNVVTRFVASKGFGSWTAYQGRGARTLVAEMAVSAMVLQAEAASICAGEQRLLDQELMLKAIRAADWLLVHLVDRQPFVDWLGEAEHQSPDY